MASDDQETDAGQEGTDAVFEGTAMEFRERLDSVNQLLRRVDQTLDSLLPLATSIESTVNGIATAICGLAHELQNPDLVEARGEVRRCMGVLLGQYQYALNLAAWIDREKCKFD